MALDPSLTNSRPGHTSEAFLWIRSCKWDLHWQNKQSSSHSSIPSNRCIVNNLRKLSQHKYQSKVLGQHKYQSKESGLFEGARTCPCSKQLPWFEVLLLFVFLLFTCYSYTLSLFHQKLAHKLPVSNRVSRETPYLQPSLSPAMSAHTHFHPADLLKAAQAFVLRR